MPRWVPFAAFAAFAAILGVLAALLIGGCGTESPDPDPASVIIPSPKVGDSKVHVVGVDIKGRNVPCVLYDGYQSVAIDCLPELLAP